mgnify:CR=1 FL=1
MLTRTYDIDVVPGGIPVKIHLSQYDSDVTLVFRLYASSGVLDIPATGVTARIRGTKNDRHGISTSATFAIVDSIPTVTVQVTKQMTAIAGANVFELVLTATSGGIEYDLPTANFFFVIERAALDMDTIESTSQIQEIQSIMDRADDIIEAATISAETQDTLRGLTTRSENAATAAETAQGLAEDARDDAQEARDDAQSAVSGFSTTVTNATSTATSDITTAKNAAVADATRDIGDAKDDALDDISDALSDALDDISDAKDDAVGDVDDAKDSAMRTINAKAQDIDDVKSAADTIAAQALSTANSAANEISTLEGNVTTVQNAYTALEAIVAGKVDGGYVENNALYLTSDGEVVAGPFEGIGGGGGGGGSQNDAILTLTNASGFVSTTIAAGGSCSLSVSWSSLESGVSTGAGTLTVIVSGITRSVREVAQGSVTIDISDYLSTGTNSVRVKITDTYGNEKYKIFTISVIDVSLESSFDDSVIQSSACTFPYIPYGAVSKTFHVYIDGVAQETFSSSVSGRQQTYIIPAQAHGAHTLRMYFEATINGTTVRSNELYYDIIWTTLAGTATIIASSYSQTTVAQYSTVSIPYMVYTPGSQVSTVTVSVDETQVYQGTADRTKQVFSRRFNSSGTHTVTVASGGVTKTITLTVTAVSVDVQAVTEGLSLYLSSSGRSNSESNPASWVYGSVACSFSGFGWVSDGWIQDEDGIPAMRVTGNARLTIPYQIFATDFRTSGKTIEIEFTSRDVLDYDTTIISCLSGGRGLAITPQSCRLTSEQSSLGTFYKENEHIRVSFVVEKRSGLRRIYCYIDGILSGCIQYPDDDDFSQVTPASISIGSSLCTTDIYCIRVYDTDLNSQQIEENWIADTQDGGLLLERYRRNDVRDEYGSIVISKLPSNLPYLIIECEELPQYKGDKKTVSGSYTDPEVPAKSFTFTGAQADVQGTSSQYYERKNYKIKFLNGFILSGGSAAATYSMRSGSMPTNAFCFKADVASSEGANNVELARLYNDSCPYRTPAQVADSRVRQGIDGFPIVIFWRQPSQGMTTFLGKYNFNNDKGTEEVFGLSSGDESWEILNNTSNRVLWKSADYTGSDWLSDFEARYPDTDPPYTDPTQLQEFAEWIVSTDTAQATGETLSAPITYDGTVYTTDSAAYRLAKFKAELGDYVELQSALFYYLFTELFLMVDSRAKNMFPSFIGGDVNE